MGVCFVLLFMSGNCQELLPQEHQQCRIRENPTLSIQTLQLHQILVCTGKSSTEGPGQGLPDSEGNCRLQRQHVGDHHGRGHTHRQHVAEASQETSSFSTSLQKSWRQKKAWLNIPSRTLFSCHTSEVTQPEATTSHFLGSFAQN